MLLICCWFYVEQNGNGYDFGRNSVLRHAGIRADLKAYPWASRKVGFAGEAAS